MPSVDSAAPWTWNGSLYVPLRDADIRFKDNRLVIENPANTFVYRLQAAAIAANRALNLPLLTAEDTLAVLGLAQTWTQLQTINSVAVTNTTDATSTTTGSLKTAGGLGVAKAVRVGTLFALPNYVKATFTKSINDNTPTGIARITIPDLDTGEYACFVRALIAATASNQRATKAFAAAFSRAQIGTGVGVLSAVSEIVEAASAAISAANVDIGAVTMTVVETTELQHDITFTVDVTGTDAGNGNSVTIVVELIHANFASEPTITQL